MIIALIYIVLFVLIIYKIPFFKKSKLSLHYFSTAFILKIIAGFALTWIYTVHYTDRSTADIYKYYDDAKCMYAAVDDSPMDYLKMVTSIGNDEPKFDSLYYSKMNHWYRKYDFGVYNDNHTMIRINALMMPLAFGSFHVHTVIMCFIGFLGLMALFLFFQEYFIDRLTLLYAALFLLPSVLFWGSGVLKEGLLLFSLGFFIYYGHQLFVKRSFSMNTILFFLLSVSVFLINKSYLLYITFPLLFIFIVIERFEIKKVIVTYLFSLLIMFFSAYLISKNFSTQDPLQTFVLKQRDFINLSKGGVFLINADGMARIETTKKIFLDSLGNNEFKIKNGSSYMYWKLDDFNDTIRVNNSNDTALYKLVWDLPLAGSAINVAPLEPNFISFAKHAPQAFFNVLFQPVIWKADSINTKLAALENMIITLFLCCSILFLRKAKINLNLLLFTGTAVIILFLLIGYTTPIVGAMVRYKIPFLPFLVLMGVHLIDMDKLKRISFLKKLL